MPPPDLTLTPSQIRRRSNDYDSQVRQALEEGNVRQLIKRLGIDLVSLLSHRANGSSEQRAAFPQGLFLFQFVRDWNTSYKDPHFVENQLQELQRFDAAPRTTKGMPSASEPNLVPAPPPPQIPRPRPVPAPIQPQVPVRPPQPVPAPSPLRSSNVNSDTRHLKPHLDVAMPPAQSYRQISRSEDDEDAGTKEVLVYVKACERCMKGKRDCEVDEVGGACVACKAHKYGCSHTGTTGLKTMLVMRPASESESAGEQKDPRRGKKREVEPVRVKKEKKPKPEKPKPRPKAPPAAKKAKGKVREATKSSPIVMDSDDDRVDEDEIEEDEGAEPEPKAKRARFMNDHEYKYLSLKQDQRIAVLEARVDAYAKDTSRHIRRLDTMEEQLLRSTGALETFLGRISIYDHLRLVPETLRIDTSTTPASVEGLLGSKRSRSPSLRLDIPMDEEANSTIPIPILTTSTVPDRVGLATSYADSELPPALPTVNLIPATPHDSQEVRKSGEVVSYQASSPLPVGEVDDDPPLLPQVELHGVEGQMSSELAVPGGRKTRFRSRSKTPI